MKDELGAQLACQNKKPLIDGRRANVQLAYLGAKKKTKDGMLKLYNNGFFIDISCHNYLTVVCPN